MVLDRCLVTCHDESPAQAAVPPCHEHAATGLTASASLHGVGACGHDHDTLDAERVGDMRAGSTLHFSLVALVPAARVSVPPSARQRSERRSEASPPPAQLTIDLPLRI